MRVFVTGATGFVGSAVVQDLLHAGHQVLGLARSDKAVKALASTGASVHHGSLDDPESLRRGVAACEGVIHTAFIHDFSNMGPSGEVDLRAIEAMGAELAGSGRPLVVTSAVALLPAGRVGTEADAPDERTATGGYRIASEHATLALASRGVRVSLVRLSHSVHDTGDYGFVPALIRTAREKGVSAYVGEGHNRWCAVHRRDAAHLYRLALEKGQAGARFHGVAEGELPTRDLAEAIGQHLKLPVVSVPPENAAQHFSWLARFYASDSPASSAQTRTALGWTPRHPGLLQDLEIGQYFAS